MQTTFGQRGSPHPPAAAQPTPQTPLLNIGGWFRRVACLISPAMLACFTIGEIAVFGMMFKSIFEGGSFAMLISIPLFSTAAICAVPLGFVGGMIFLSPMLLLDRWSLWEKMTVGAVSGALFDAVGISDFMVRHGDVNMDPLTGITGAWVAALAGQTWGQGEVPGAIVMLLGPPIAGAIAARRYHRIRLRVVSPQPNIQTAAARG